MVDEVDWFWIVIGLVAFLLIYLVYDLIKYRDEDKKPRSHHFW